MKFLITSFALVFSSMTLACTNFSGTFAYPWNPKFQIIQTGCESLQLNNDARNLTILTDGKFHETFNENVEVGGEVVGKIITFHKASFTQSELLLDTVENWEVLGDVGTSSTTSVNTMLENGDLKTDMTLEDGQVRTGIAKRIK